MRTWMFAALGALALLVVGCREPDSVLPAAEPGQVELVSAFDFPREDRRSSELSGIAWDGEARVLYAISDTVPAIVPLRPSADFATWAMGDPIVVNVPHAWDGEGIALTPTGFFVANERGSHIYQIDRTGTEIAELKIPPHFTRAVRNKELESLSITPDNRYLFTANESTLTGDGPPPSTANGATIRILRHDLTTGDEVEHAYRTDPIFAAGEGADMGVSDMLALSATDLLVMERSFVPGVGNAIKIYRARFAGRSVLATAALSLTTPVVQKAIFLDFAWLPGAEMKGRGKNAFPNYEGLALGPVLPDGRRALFVIADDNANPALVARLLVLGVRL